MKFLNLQKIILFTLFWMSIPLSFSQTNSLSKEAEISVLTCGTSTEVYALFGHTAIRVKDKANGIDVVYNYGAFDFSTPNFIGRFVKGDLQYFVTNGSYIDFYYNYQTHLYTMELINEVIYLDILLFSILIPYQ